MQKTTTKIELNDGGKRRPREKVVKLLLKEGADVNIRGPGCETALDIAKRAHRSEIDALLRAHEAEE